MNTLTIWRTYFKSLLTPETEFLLPYPHDNTTNTACECEVNLDGCTVSPSQDEGPKVLPAVSQKVTVSKVLKSLNTLYLN